LGTLWDSEDFQIEEMNPQHVQSPLAMVDLTIQIPDACRP
jgi:hypothetical protein